eukprot:SAG11_NODE_3289_length_2551_cov_2.607667_3_plen_179_part_00
MHRKSTFIVDGGFVNTENTYYELFTFGRTSTDASDARFSTGSEIPFWKNVLCLPVGRGSTYVPDTPFCIGTPVDTGFVYGSGILFWTQLPFAPGSCHLQIIDQYTCSQHTDCDAVHMSCNGSIPACTSKSASCAVWKTVRCDEESVPPCSLAVGHDSVTHIEESYNSESSSDQSLEII